MHLMKRRKADSAISSASTSQVKRFERGVGSGPSLDDFNLDLNGTPRNKWNEAAATLFARSLVSTGWTRCQDTATIRDMFLVHISTLKTLYEKQSHEGAEREEDRQKERQARRERRRRHVGWKEIRST